MKKQDNRGSILNIQDGNLIKRIDRVFAEIMENINDSSYPADKARKLVITLEFKADSERKKIHMKADIKKSLPAKATLVTDLFNYKVRDKVGNTASVLEENMGVPAGQMNIYGDEVKPALVVYNVEEKTPVIDEPEEVEVDVVKPLPAVNEKFEPNIEEMRKGTTLKI